MTSDHDALLAAISEQPDEDTPRLAYADWLEEYDQPVRAAFVRAQVELARTPPWEPFAVLCKWRRPDWFTGQPFRDTLPRVDGSGVEWHPEAFRRGLGWRLNVKSLIAWEQQESLVLGRAPVGEMHLWTATLDQWRAFAESPVVPRLRRIHLATNPIEPMRVLRDSPAALGITDIFFERASGVGMPFVVEELLAAPLGRAVRGLHFRMGGEPLEDLIQALNTNAERTRIERLSMATMGLTSERVVPFITSAVAQNLTELDLRGNMLGVGGLFNLLNYLPAGLQTLGLAATGPPGRGLESLATSFSAERFRRLDLSRNPFTPRAMQALSQSHALAGLRSLDLSKCRLGKRELRHLTRAKFWSNLVELDLRGIQISPASVRHLLDALVPPDLTALVLDSDQLGPESRTELTKKYGERVVFRSESHAW